MQIFSVKELGFIIKKAGKLESNLLCVYGSDTIPNNSVPTKNLDGCFAHAVYKLAVDKSNDIISIYVGQETLKGCCPGGQAWFGFKGFPPMLEYFLSSGSKDFRSGAAEYLIATPELAKERLTSTGKITPLGKYIVIQKSDTIIEESFKVTSILFFGNSESMRNISMLAYFSEKDAYNMIKMPMGPSCATFVTYPSQMAENGPDSSIILGPTDPTGNYWFPPNLLAMGIPIDIANRMCNDYEDSFLVKRPDVAYPKKRI